jgi:transposase
MRGPKPSHPISLTEAEVKQLQQQVRAHTTGQSAAVRARILLSAHEHPEWSNQQIAQAVGTRDRTVRKWRGRWVATRSIADAPGSGAPRHFSPCRACTSDSNGLPSATTERRATSTLESASHSTTGGNYGEWASPFQQNGRTLVESRAVATMALSYLATHS